MRKVDDISSHLQWIHPDAQAPRQELITRSERIFNGEDEDTESDGDSNDDIE